MNFIKFIRIFLLILIVIGIGLLVTQKMWVPKVVDMILSLQAVEEENYNNPANSSQDKNTQSSKKTFTSNRGYSFEYPSNYTVNNYENPTQQEIFEGERGKNAVYIDIPQRYDYHDNLTNASEEVFLKNSNVSATVFCEAASDTVSRGDDIVKQTKFTNKNNVTYYETYFNYYHFSNGGKEYEGIVGPIYSMKFSSQNAILFMYAPFFDCYPRPTIQPSQTIVSDILENFSVIGV